MSGLSGTLGSGMTRCGHEATERSRSGAGDETTGRYVAGDGQTDHLVSGSGDPGHQLPADAALENSFSVGRLRRFIRSAARPSFTETGALENGGGSAAFVSGAVLR